MPKFLILALFASGLSLPAHAADSSNGRLKSIACRGCHGVHGISKNPEFPHLAGQSQGYLKKSLQEFRSGERQDPSMNRIANSLSDADIRDLALYYAQLPR